MTKFNNAKPQLFFHQPNISRTRLCMFTLKNIHQLCEVNSQIFFCRLGNSYKYTIYYRCSGQKVRDKIISLLLAFVFFYQVQQPFHYII